MKNNFFRNRAFTMIECIFAIFILSVISIYIIFGINTFLRIQNVNINNNEKLLGIENTVVLIRNNIKTNKSILNEVNTKKYDVKILDLGELYNIKIFLKDDTEKVYEFYISK
ncbi:type II secretion system protein J [Parvimonas sp. G1967]|uniref:PulJ/GspJ family protein n=1 Tax=Parvimonas sp. G1967 TaxID=3387695 RepID=UPI0039E6BB3B